MWHQECWEVEIWEKRLYGGLPDGTYIARWGCYPLRVLDGIVESVPWIGF